MGNPQENLFSIFEATRLARTTDPDTSHLAAQTASVRGPNQRIKVWDALNFLGEATDFELSEYLGILRSSAGKRRQELTELGLVEPTDFRRPTDTGAMSIVWRPCRLSELGCPF